MAEVGRHISHASVTTCCYMLRIFKYLINCCFLPWGREWIMEYIILIYGQNPLLLTHLGCAEIP